MSSRPILSRPVKMWLNGKVFHIINPNKNKTVQHVEDQNNNNQVNIIAEGDEYKTEINVPKAYHSKILNWPEFNLSKFPNARVYVPNCFEEGSIILQSRSSEDLLEAAHYMHFIISEIRHKITPCHFTCIPCAHSNIRDRFENFKKNILDLSGNIKGLDESIFMNPSKLHVTIDVYSLLDELEQAEAAKALIEYKNIFEATRQKIGPLTLEIGTLNFMGSNIKRVNVLYADVKLLNESNEHSLQSIVDNIAKHFYDRGLAKKFQDSIKLHMTVINTKYRKGSYRIRKRLPIDASLIMEQFKDYSFGQCSFDSIHLSHMTMVDSNGFYKPLAVLQLDENKDQCD